MFGCYPNRKRVALPLDVIISHLPKYIHREKEGAMFSSGYCLGRSGIVSFFRLGICDDWVVFLKLGGLERNVAN